MVDTFYTVIVWFVTTSCYLSRSTIGRSCLKWPHSLHGNSLGCDNTGVDCSLWVFLLLEVFLLLPRLKFIVICEIRNVLPIFPFSALFVFFAFFSRDCYDASSPRLTKGLRLAKRYGWNLSVSLPQAYGERALSLLSSLEDLETLNSYPTLRRTDFVNLREYWRHGGDWQDQHHVFKVNMHTREN